MKTTEIAVIGGGPAGLSAAIVASRLGAQVTLIDDNQRPGGQLIKQTHKFFGDKTHYCGTRGIDIAAILANELKLTTTEVVSGTSVIGFYPGSVLALADRKRFFKLSCKSLIVATGAAENNLLFPNNDLPGVYGAGAVQTLVNVYGVRPGKRVLMVGSGNIGLIVSYQLIQAGIRVVAVVEALPRIGGYNVHAAKLARLGIPILTSHTIKSAIGREYVTGAIVCKLDRKFHPVKNSEHRVKVDIICLAVGLTPLTEILWQAGCHMVYIPELGGHVAWHNETMQTNQKNIYVAGDVSGIEEASTAMLEGRLAGASAFEYLRGKSKESRMIINETRTELRAIRQGPFSRRVVRGKKKLAKSLL